MKIGILTQIFNEGRQIAMDYENNECNYEKSMERVRVRAQERFAAKSMVAAALGFAKLNDEKSYRRMMKLLLGTGTQTPLLETPEELYDRTAERGHE